MPGSDITRPSALHLRPDNVMEVRKAPLSQSAPVCELRVVDRHRRG
jgi:hypothetical protein